MILGLDLGRSVGVAGVDKLGVPVFAHSWVFGQEDHGVLVHSFYVRLKTALKRFEPELVAYEDLTSAHMQSKAWRSIWFGMRTSVLLACEGLGVAYVGVPVSAWKGEFNVPHRKPESETVAMVEAEKLQRSLPPSQRIVISNSDLAVAVLVAATARRRAA